MCERILAQNCQKFDNFNFEFSMSHHNAHYQSYKNAPAEEGVCSIIRLGSFEILKKYVCSRFKLIGACLPSKKWVYMGKYKSELACQGPTGIKLWELIPWWNWRLNIFAESFLWGSESRALAWLRLWLRRAETSFNVSTSSQEPLLSLSLSKQTAVEKQFQT